MTPSSFITPRLLHSAFRIPRSAFRRLHADQRGAIGVLVLLTIWCLVGLIAMLWNTADYAVRRQRLQNAADAIAYSSALQTSRTLNQTTAQNILIAQDASADIIFRAAKDTDVSIDNELQAELVYLDEIEKQQRALRSRLPGLIARIATQYDLLQDALGLVQQDLDNGTITFSSNNDGILYKNKVRQAGYAANWVNSQYVPQLVALAQQAMNAQLTQQMIDEARATIGARDNPLSGSEYYILGLFEQQINSAPANTSEMMQAHEQDLFQDQQELLAATQDAQQHQLTALADYHHVNLSDGTPPSMIQPIPVQDAHNVETVPHTDSITGQDVTLDPINPNTGDAAITHPAETIYFDTLPSPRGVNFNTPGGWGHCWLFPLERYLQGRVAGDSVLLRVTFMTPIDTLRQDLALRWAQELGILMNVPGLPNTIPDPQPNPITKQPATIPILPDLTATTAKGSKTDPDFDYRRTSASYLNAVRNLASVLRNYAGLYNRFTAPYAVRTYNGHLVAERSNVAQEVGTNKGFMVLNSYKLQNIPAWAIPGMHDSLVRAISWQIYSQQYPWYHSLNEVYAKINPYVEEIAQEMLSRPWPYEKTPPQVPVPPTAGMTKADRQNFFSSFIVIANQPDGRRGVMFPRLFGDSPPFVAYAQAESNNWMEYNESYGDYYTEKFDEVSLNTFGSLLACPRAWRLSTIGGWNWRPRLAQADMMGRLLNPQDSLYNTAVSDAFYHANITKGDPTSIDELNLH